MSLFGWILTVWFGLSFGAVALGIAREAWLTHRSRDRARGFLIEDRELRSWVELWESTYAAPSRQPRGIA